jgi:hypothetical protein
MCDMSTVSLIPTKVEIYNLQIMISQALLSSGLPTDIVKSINTILGSSRTEKIIRMALNCIQNLLKSKAMCEGEKHII